jgi:hypothetical protein
MRTWFQLTWRERSILARGKIRRFWLVHFRPRAVEASLARRRGECDRTGACCNVLFTCPLLGANPLPACRIHRHKPRVCRMFPIDERDLRDRDIISPGHPCGYSFASRPGNAGGALRND